MSNPGVVGTARHIYHSTEILNALVRAELPTLTLAEASELVRLCRETEAWLFGIRKLVDVYNGPSDQDPV